MFFVPSIPDKRNYRARRWLRRVGAPNPKTKKLRKGLPYWALFFVAPSSEWRILPPAGGSVEGPEEEGKDRKR